MTYILFIVNLVAGSLMLCDALCAASDACNGIRRNLAAGILWALLGGVVIVNGVRLWP